MENTLERLNRRLPAWARDWPRRRILAAAAVVVLVVVIAVSCAGGSGGRADVPVVEGEPDAAVSGVRAPSSESSTPPGSAAPGREAPSRRVISPLRFLA